MTGPDIAQIIEAFELAVRNERVMGREAKLDAARSALERRIEQAEAWAVAGCRAWIEGAPHGNVEDCPTYYDGCHCTTQVLIWNIMRAEAAEGCVDYEREVLRTIAHFPITDPRNMDAVNMQLLARRALGEEKP